MCKQRLSPALSLPVPQAACTLVTSSPQSCPPPSCPQLEPPPRVQPCEGPCSSDSGAPPAVLATQPQPPAPVRSPRQYSAEPSSQWVAQAWGPCSVTCGAGLRERRVHCVDTRGGLVPDGRCRPHYSRPQSEDYCEAEPCVAEGWLMGPWEKVGFSSYYCSYFSSAPSPVGRASCTGEWSVWAPAPSPSPPPRLSAW